MLRSGDAAAAERASRAALLQYPDDANFLALLGAALNRQNRSVEAEVVLRKAIDADPGYAKAHEALAHALLAQKRPADAVPVLRQAVSLNPALKSAQVTLSQALLAAGLEQEAKDAFDELLQRHPRMQRLAKATEHHRAGQFEQAEAIYRELLRQDPDDVTVSRLFGVLALDAGNYRNAAVLLRQAVKLAPGFHAAWIDLCRAQIELHELDDAFASAERAIQLDPGRAGGYIALGEVSNHSDVTQSDIAATMLQYLGLDHRKFNQDAGPPISGSLKPPPAN